MYTEIQHLNRTLSNENEAGRFADLLQDTIRFKEVETENDPPQVHRLLLSGHLRFECEAQDAN